MCLSALFGIVIHYSQSGTPLHPLFVGQHIGRVPSANSTQWDFDLKASSKLLNFFVSHNNGSTSVYHQTFLLDAASWLLLSCNACVLDPKGVIVCFLSRSDSTIIGDFPCFILLVFTSAGGITVAVTVTMAAPRLSSSGFCSMTFQPTFKTQCHCLHSLSLVHLTSSVFVWPLLLNSSHCPWTLLQLTFQWIQNFGALF